MNHLLAIAAGIGVLGGGSVVVGRAVIIVRRIFHMVDAIETVVSRELEHNHGGSIKDDTYGVALTVGKLWRRVEDVEAEVQQLRGTLTTHLDRSKP